MLYTVSLSKMCLCSYFLADIKSTVRVKFDCIVCHRHHCDSHSKDWAICLHIQYDIRYHIFKRKTDGRRLMDLRTQWIHAATENYMDGKKESQSAVEGVGTIQERCCGRLFAQ